MNRRSLPIMDARKRRVLVALVACRLVHVHPRTTGTRRIVDVHLPMDRGTTRQALCTERAAGLIDHCAGATLGIGAVARGQLGRDGPVGWGCGSVLAMGTCSSSRPSVSAVQPRRIGTVRRPTLSGVRSRVWLVVRGMVQCLTGGDVEDVRSDDVDRELHLVAWAHLLRR
jgi:hypothetical protein